jgi:hypothetical protein
MKKYIIKGQFSQSFLRASHWLIDGKKFIRSFVNMVPINKVFSLKKIHYQGTVHKTSYEILTMKLMAQSL